MSYVRPQIFAAASSAKKSPSSQGGGPQLSPAASSQRGGTPSTPPRSSGMRTGAGGNMAAPSPSHSKAGKQAAARRQAEEEDDEDLYEGYNTVSSEVIHTVANKTVARPPTQGGALGFGMYGGGGNQAVPGTAARPGTEFNPNMPRPMTSAVGAGYTSTDKSKRTVFDPLMQGASSLAPALEEKVIDTPAHQAKLVEKQVHALLEESAAANLYGDYATALEKAKEAGKKERALHKLREKHDLMEHMNYDLTFAVAFNLANQYHASGMLAEALSTYEIIVKNKQYPQAGRLRVNMGNIYFQQKKYKAAVRHYQMAMDMIGPTSKAMRFKILRNIGNSWVLLGQFQEAIQSFETVMEAAPDATTGFNLVVCYYATGDKDKMKRGFLQLLAVPVAGADSADQEEDKAAERDVLQAEDELAKDQATRRKKLEKYVHIAAKLIAPVIDKDPAAGFDWIIENLKTARKNANSPATGRDCFPRLAMEMEIAKGISFLKQKHIPQAIEVFKNFEKNDAGLIDQAATNLSFLYFLEGDYKSAERYADIAVKADRYNAKALVNKANVLFMQENYEPAKELYLEAIGVEVDCIEAIFNLGLVNKRLGLYEDALQAFRKLHRIVPKDVQVIFQLGHLYDMIGDAAQATEWFKILQGLVPTDPKVLFRLGQLYLKQDDDNQAFHNFLDSHNVYPVNMEVISWLGVWYVKSELYENAIQFFERAAEIEPDAVKWKLMVASCYRRMNSLSEALALYKEIHKQDPDNVECLRYLCSLSKSNEAEFEHYSKLLRKAERALKAKQAESAAPEVQRTVSITQELAQQHSRQPAAYGQDDEERTRQSTTSRAGERRDDTIQRAMAAAAQVDDSAHEQQHVDIDPEAKISGQTVVPRKGDDDGWWGDGELGDELLPMG